MYLSLKHAGYPIDAVLEADCVAGYLRHYSVLYVLSTPQITGACGRAIAAWVASGGILVSTGGGGLLDGAPASPLMPDLHRSPRSRFLRLASLGA